MSFFKPVQVLYRSYPSGRYNSILIAYKHFKHWPVPESKSPDLHYLALDKGGITRLYLVNRNEFPPVLVGTGKGIQKITHCLNSLFLELSGNDFAHTFKGTDRAEYFPVWTFFI